MERWPPTYDADQLRDQIRALAGSDSLEAEFYTSDPDLTLCQGDVFQLQSPIPLIDEEGDAVAIDDVEYWMAMGNTCDFTRTLEEVEWTQLVPVLDLGLQADIPNHELQELRSYQPFRSFYVPWWKAALKDRVMVADFTRPVGAHKSAVTSVATLEARLTLSAWALFHSCLIRFLARDDGRHD